jgi:hypothetical protein
MKPLKVTHTRCQCAECGEYFNSVGAFDKHRIHRVEKKPVYPYCLSPDGMLLSGMVKNASGYWCSSANTFSRGAA